MSFSIVQRSVTVCGKDAELFLIDGFIDFLEEDKAVQEIESFFVPLIIKKNFGGGMALVKSSSHLPLSATVIIAKHLFGRFPIILGYNKKLGGYIVATSNNLSYKIGSFILESKIKQH